VRTAAGLADEIAAAEKRGVASEFVDGKYAQDTRPQDKVIQAGKGGAIGWGLCTTMVSTKVEDETIIDNREYHTMKEEE
jgi:4-O-beta-D-mannosyl-D-glucose phosphorylase